MPHSDRPFDIQHFFHVDLPAMLEAGWSDEEIDALYFGQVDSSQLPTDDPDND